MTINLRHCPFCGSDIVGSLLSSSDKTDKLGVVHCGLCGCWGPSLYDGDELARRWNERVVDESHVERIDRERCELIGRQVLMEAHLIRLPRLLRRCLSEIQEHEAEYQHRTDAAFIDELRKVIGDVDAFFTYPPVGLAAP